MPPRNINFRSDGNAQIRFANGSYIETPVRSVEIELPYEVKPALDYLTSAGVSGGTFYADVELGDLKTWIDKINEFAEPTHIPSERDFWKSFMEMQDMSCKKETEPIISFEETMGFNT